MLVIALAVLAVIAVLFILVGESVKSQVEDELGAVKTNTSQKVQANEPAIYTDVAYGYQIAQPDGYVLNTSRNVISDGYITESKPLVSSWAVNAPKSLYEGTNVTRVHMGVGVFEADKAACVDAVNGNPVINYPDSKTSQEVVGRESFIKVTGIADAGAGQFETTEFYAAHHNSLCYRIIMIAHGFNDIAQYNADNPDEKIKAYSEEVLQKAFKEFAQTFAFTK